VDPNPEMVAAAADTGTDRVELYTESYATQYAADREKAIAPYIQTAKAAIEAGLGINAGHDLDRTNLRYFYQNIPDLLEVSIGHALVCDALYLGLENTIRLYLRELR
jgi:pyridoxine 5-phosphate synthase